MPEAAPKSPAAAKAKAKAPSRKSRQGKAVASGAPPGKGKGRASGPSVPVTELLSRAVAASKERGGVSLAALKKALAAAGYDVEKNKSRIKLGLRSLVAKGVLLQTSGSGASGSFRLNRQQQKGEAKPRGKPSPKAGKPRQPPAKAKAKPGRKPKSPAKKAKKPQPKKAPKSPAKAKAKPRTPKAKSSKAKPKKK